MTIASGKSKDALIAIKFILIYFTIIPFLTFLIGDKNPLRWVDYDTYRNYFEIASSRTLLGIFEYGQDPFFVALMKPFTMIDNGFSYFTLFCASVTLLIKYNALKNSTDNRLVLFVLFVLYASYFLCLHDYIQIRVSLALAFVLYSIYYVDNKKWKLLLFITAALIHLSVVFAILVYVFTLRFKGKYKAFIFSAIFIMPFIIFSGLIHNVRLDTYIMMVKYKENYYQANIFATQPILQSISIIYIYLNRELRLYCQYKFEYIFSCVGVIAFYSMFQVPVLSFRFYEMTMLFFYILMSKIMMKSKFMMLIYFLLILLGLKQMFYGDSALLILKQ